MGQTGRVDSAAAITLDFRFALLVIFYRLLLAAVLPL